MHEHDTAGSGHTHNHEHGDLQGSGHTHNHEHDALHSFGHLHAHEDSTGQTDAHAHSFSGAAGGKAHMHHHTHSLEETRAVVNRLSRAIGHLESVKRMVQRGEDCSDVLIQLAAVRNAINNTGKVIMKNHISHCIVDAIEANDMEPVDALNEAIDYFIK